MVSRSQAAASLGVLAFAVLAPRPALVMAQEPDAHALAAQLFDEAGRAQDRGALDEACPKFAKVVELEPAKVGAKIALADCYAQAGKLASAAAAYRAAGARAAEAGDPRQKQADDKAAELDAKAPRLTIDVPEPLRSLPGLTVLCDGAPVGAAQWSRALASDPGQHTISVSAPGKKPWTGNVTLSAGATAQIVIGALEDAPPPAPVAAPGPSFRGPLAGEAVPPSLDAPSRSVPVWAWVFGGFGLASGAAAVAFGVDQAATQSDFDAHCKNAPEDASCADRSARLWRDFGLWIGLGAASVAGLAAATIGVVTAPRRGSQAPANGPLRASFWIAPLGAGAALLGRF